MWQRLGRAASEGGSRRSLGRRKGHTKSIRGPGDRGESRQSNHSACLSALPMAEGNNGEDRPSPALTTVRPLVNVHLLSHLLVISIPKTDKARHMAREPIS